MHLASSITRPDAQHDAMEANSLYFSGNSGSEGYIQ